MLKKIQKWNNLLQITDLITQLNTKVMTVPTQLERVSADLSKEKEKKDELLSMKSLNEKMNLFKEKEKPELEKQLATVETVSIVLFNLAKLLIFSTYNSCPTFYSQYSATDTDIVRCSLQLL